MADRYAGPLTIVLLSLSIALGSQLAVYFATGYSRLGDGAKLVSTRKTAELLWWLAIVQLVALTLALVLLVLTNVLDPGNVELNQLPEMVASAEEGEESRKRTGRMVRKMPDGAEIEFRWCWHCSIWRPPMANHCPTCNRCFLKLDHHCPWTGNCIAAHNIRFFWAMIACFGLAGSLIPIGLAAFFASAVLNHDHVHAAVIAIGALFALYLVCTFGSMWIGASVMLARTAKTVCNPRGGKSATLQNQAEWFEDMLSRERAEQDCSVLSAPCRCRQH